MEYKDYYRILGVGRNADDKAIKTAYRKLARKWHPDVAKGSEDRFKEISEAYEVLSDPDKRKRYDTLGPDWERFAEARTGSRSPFEGEEVRFGAGDLGGFSDFFRVVFGDLGARGRTRGPRQAEPGDLDLGDLGELGRRRGGDVEGKLEITLEEAFAGARRTVTLDADEPCRACGGAGHVNRNPCSGCRGTGWSRRRRQLEVKVPAGVETGSRIRVAGEGAQGFRGGARGDLYLTVQVPDDPRFERRGDDLYVSLTVPVADAALGTEVQVPTLKGQVSMTIPPGTSGGKTFRLPGYGMPHLKGGGAGDQYVRVQLVFPAGGLSAREQELYGELKRLRAETSR
jgi:DnaJ-class molecular chaperone